MAVDGFHINGPALVYVDTGRGSSHELLGYTLDGVTVDFIRNTQEVFTDAFGEATPQAFRDLGEVAAITVPLIASDTVVLSKVMNKGDRAAPGKMNTNGLILGPPILSREMRLDSGGQSVPTGVVNVLYTTFELGITSTMDVPYTFFRCIWRPVAKVKKGVKAMPFAISFFAFPESTFTTHEIKDARLYAESFGRRFPEGRGDSDNDDKPDGDYGSGGDFGDGTGLSQAEIDANLRDAR